MKQKLFSILALLLMAATGAWATDYTTLAVGDVIKVGDTFTSTANGAFNDFGFHSGDIYTLMRADVDNEGNVTEKTDGAYYVFKRVSDFNPYIHFGKAFAVTTISDGLEVTKIETVKGNLSYTLAVHEPTATTGYNITLDEGTDNKDSQNWEITPKSSELSGGEAVTVKYNGSREVKSVTVVKKGGAAGNTYLRWNGKQKKLVEEEIPAEAIVVTSTSGDYQCSEGTYVVEGNVEIKGRITLIDGINLIIKDGAKLTANKIVGNSNKLYIYGQAKMTGELVVNCPDDDAIYGLTTLEVHSAKVTATSSSSGCGGFYNIKTFNVYGGLVDAKCTAADEGYGILLSGAGSMNIYGGEVKAEGKGSNSSYSYGITCMHTTNDDKSTVTVYGGKLWAGNANYKALNSDITLTIEKSSSFDVEIYTSSDNSTWNPTVGTPDSKYVRVGY